MPTKLIFTRSQKKKMIARMIYVGVRECFRNHAYNFKDEMYIQQSGGPIGLKLTTVVAEIVMAEWDVKFREKMLENGQETLLDETYVDDQNVVTEELELGRRWDETKLSWRKDWEDEDIAEGRPSDYRTMREIRKLSNSLMDFIEMEEDVPSNYDDNRLPILDLKVWTNLANIQHGPRSGPK